MVGGIWVFVLRLSVCLVLQTARNSDTGQKLVNKYPSYPDQPHTVRDREFTVRFDESHPKSRVRRFWPGQTESSRDSDSRWNLDHGNSKLDLDHYRGMRSGSSAPGRAIIIFWVSKVVVHHFWADRLFSPNHRVCHAVYIILCIVSVSRVMSDGWGVSAQHKMVF